MQADVLVCSGCVEGSMESGIYRRGVELCILFYRTVHKPPSSESTYGQKMLSSVEDCLMFGVVALTSRRVTSKDHGDENAEDDASVKTDHDTKSSQDGLKRRGDGLYNEAGRHELKD